MNTLWGPHIYKSKDSFYITDLESPWHCVSKTLPGWLIGIIIVWDNSLWIKNFLIDLALCYIIKTSGKICVCRCVCVFVYVYVCVSIKLFVYPHTHLKIEHTHTCKYTHTHTQSHTIFFLPMVLLYSKMPSLLNICCCCWILSFLTQFFFSDQSYRECFVKTNPRAFQINCLQYLFILPSESKLHSKTHKMKRKEKNVLKPSWEDV